MTDRRARLDAARLYLVLPLRSNGRAATEIAAAALAGGVDIVQLRDKDARDAELVDAARSLRPLCEEHRALLIVNDRPDVALEAGADGVHLGQDDEPVDAVRRRLGGELLIGLSTHTRVQVEAGDASQADYLGVGPVYATPTKPQAEAVGLGLVRHASAVARKPCFAIGGIDAERASAVAAAGARRIAVIRAICDAEDPGAAARALHDTLAGVVSGSR